MDFQNYDPNKSDWNMAMATCQRIDTNIRMAQRARIEKDYETWTGCLLNIHSELYARSNPKEQPELEKMSMNLMNFLDLKESGEAFNTVKWRSALNTFELRMRVIIRKLGLDLPDAGDPSKALS